MKSTLLVALALAVTAPPTATAQFVPTLGSDTPRICPEQPPRPDWIENINFRDADKAILVQEMYRAQSMQAVADTGDCSCETRYPRWDAAEAYYFENYALLKERWPLMERTSEYRRTANEYRRIAIPICREQGNW